MKKNDYNKGTLETLMPLVKVQKSNEVKNPDNNRKGNQTTHLQS